MVKMSPTNMHRKKSLAKWKRRHAELSICIYEWVHSGSALNTPFYEGPVEKVYDKQRARSPIMR
jgi:hypothetical protein